MSFEATNLLAGAQLPQGAPAPPATAGWDGAVDLVQLQQQLNAVRSLELQLELLLQQQLLLG
jgi:hypothetical protein